jgi:hypothetical protein
VNTTGAKQSEDHSPKPNDEIKENNMSEMSEAEKPQFKKKKPNSFSVLITKNGRNVVIELHDIEECSRPSVQKDIHLAMKHRIKQIINFANREKELKELYEHD